MNNIYNFTIMMNSVESKNISKIGYDPEKLVMEVEFIRPANKDAGERYRYTGVPIDLWLAFSESPSKGSFFAKNIKGKFEAFKYQPPVENKG